MLFGDFERAVKDLIIQNYPNDGSEVDTSIVAMAPYGSIICDIYVNPSSLPLDLRPLSLKIYVNFNYFNSQEIVHPYESVYDGFYKLADIRFEISSMVGERYVFIDGFDEKHNDFHYVTVSSTSIVVKYIPNIVSDSLRILLDKLRSKTKNNTMTLSKFLDFVKKELPNERVSIPNKTFKSLNISKDCYTAEGENTVIHISIDEFNINTSIYETYASIRYNPNYDAEYVIINNYANLNKYILGLNTDIRFLPISQNAIDSMFKIYNEYQKEK